MKKKLVSENLDQFISDHMINEGFASKLKGSIERVKSKGKALIKKMGKYYEALIDGVKQNIGIPINIALMFKGKKLDDSVYFVPSSADIKLEPSLAKFSAKNLIDGMKAKEIAERKKRNAMFKDPESYLAHVKSVAVTESKKSGGSALNENVKVLQHFDKNVPNVNTVRLQREIFKRIIDPSTTPLMIWGAPGIGKTAIINQVLASRGKKGRLIVFDAQFMTPEAWFMPYIQHTEEGAKYIDLPKGALPLYEISDDPEVNKERDELANQGNGGIIFFDELSRAAKDVQGSCLKLMGERKLENFALGSKWTIIAASNRKTDEAESGVISFSTTLGNRFVQVNFVPEYKEWRQWAADAKLNDAILHFLDFNSDNYWYTKSGEDEDQTIFASPRSWESASKSLALEELACKELGVQCTKVDKTAAIASAVGADVAAQIISFMYITDKYPMHEILNVWTKPEAGPQFERKGKSGQSLNVTDAIAVCVIAVDQKSAVKEVSSKEFTNFAKWLISIDNASVAVYAFKMLLDQHPYMHKDLGDYKEDHIKYKEGTDMLIRKYGSAWTGAVQDVVD